MGLAPDVSFIMAFLAGLLSFVSPCVLPVIPFYITFITGLTYDELTSTDNKKEIRWLTVKNSIIFIAGFSFIFIMLGAGATSVGRFFLTKQDLIRKVGGVIIIILGLYFMGVMKLKFLMSEKRVQIQNKPAGYLGTFLVGVAFAAGWTPCIGPILGSILLIASTKESVITGIELLAAYSAGLGLPLLLTAFAVNSFLAYFKKLNRWMNFISIMSGVFLLILGVLLMTNSLTIVTSLFSKYNLGWDIKIGY
ncbi:MAG: cytochrome c biogenesis protein CcdA [Nitrospinae bacterium]|nr:cytochrome c biogenesis protein CcdA [Nitrospinota bacterium]